ncbi:protein-glutamine gamma-glutamyltransferase E-like [Rhineura floridana]|uniref:protein-glutamine gamma-glutamyltransferase E-like n=1 Tax=Rhineura floridana TaxID=261503 RepID=UPI002AC8283D|nr:protein-glutamine gamma-glutamyltransferase E-like [Rhineura floridana]
MAASVKVDWKLKENGHKHHTDQYSGTELVLRRGQPCTITVVFGGSVPAPDSLTFTVATGSTAALQAKTRVAFGISSSPSSNSWGAVQTSAASGSMNISISSPANAAIGRYQLGIQTGNASSAHLGTFVLLFNPWLSEDDVFMPNNAEQEEYVLSEFGLVFAGSANRISQFGWNYGQFQNDILDISLSILDQSLSYRKDPTADVRKRNDPKYVGRVLSAMVNSNDDNGVLQGNWSGNYSGGESPSSWTGSVDILRRWKDSGFKPVRFGQCWVFAGVLTTALRCLGIPTRMISNFNSAHDTDKTLTVDVYYDSSGNPLNIASDSIWNFHVWNEGWFVRPDLGSEFNGWQILDATPQERSTGIFQCGPASLTAIKEGDVDLNYDSPFVFAEVNADRVTWTYDTATGKSTKVYSETKSIGQFTSTKAVGSYTRQDVTDNYKYAEGSAKERAVFQKARAKLNLNTFHATAAKAAEAVNPHLLGQFKVENPPEVGKDVNLVLTLKNLASAAKSLTAKMTAWSIIYTGKPIHEVWKNSVSVTLGPQEEKAFPIKISYAEYQQHLTPDNMIRTTALCQVKDGGDAVVERDITLDNPTVTMKVLGQAKVGQEVKVEVVFTNPLNEEVKDCVLLAEGSDLLTDKLKIDAPPLKAKQSSRLQFEVSPSKSGTKQLLINFSCDKFQDIKAFETIQVAE